MEQNLISKKELLDLTGISYGQLYRWKRKNLIPEEWFIKKSSFTGQETFFPKDKIMDRIAKIMNMKDDLSLDDIADYVSPNPVAVSIGVNELKERNIVSETALTLYRDLYPEKESLEFENILTIYVIDSLFQDGTISFDEGKLVAGLLEDNYQKIHGKSGELYFLRKQGISTCFLTAGVCEVFLDSSAKVVSRITISSCIEELKIKLS
jgi:hypothetical protein